MSLPFALHGFYTSIKGSAGEQAQKLAIVVAITTIIYSFAGHKEWRFIHPLLPILLVFASKSLVDAYHHTEGNTARAPQKIFRLPITTRNACILLASVPLSVYVIFFHGRGQIAAIDYLRHLPPSNISSVGFLMPCHSTPWQSHLHREDLEGHAWALGCEPPLQYVQPVSPSHRNRGSFFCNLGIRILANIKTKPVCFTIHPYAIFAYISQITLILRFRDQHCHPHLPGNRITRKETGAIHGRHI